MFVDPRNSQLSPPGVVQLKVLSAMLPFDQVSILAYVECAVRAGQKALEIAMDALRHSKILAIFELCIRQRIGPHHLRLNRD